MGEAIGGSLPLAIGIALSPIPIIAVVLMLISRKAKVNGPAFVLGWLIGLGIVGAIVLALARTGGASKSGAPATWVSWVKIALGVLLLLVAVREFRSRPHGDEQPHMPKWMATIDKTTPLVALGLEVRPRPENQERRGLHTRPLTSALKDKTSLVSGGPALTPGQRSREAGPP
jgi:hypothetical protein